MHNGITNRRFVQNIICVLISYLINKDVRIHLDIYANAKLNVTLKALL